MGLARIILLNGTSSAGKSTLARALRRQLDPSFCYFASDQLADAEFRQVELAERAAGRERFFDGFHRAVAGFAAAGNDLLVEHIVEEQRWADDLRRLLAPFDVFWVGLHAPLEEVERRERLRGDRTIGEGRFHMKTHGFCRYDVAVDSMRPVDEVVKTIVTAWQARGSR